VANKDRQDARTGAKRGITGLKEIWPFLAPYRWTMVGAAVALVVAAGSVLAIGQAIRRVIDSGFTGHGIYVDQYFLALLGVVAVLATATFSRYYLVTWLGERAIADLRQAVYNRVLELSPAYFETVRTGEVLSRLTADATLIQTVVGSSASVALRNLLMFIGGSILLTVSSPKLTGLVFLMIPVVILPIVIFGRRVKRLSRDSQDRVADVASYAGESLNAIQVVQAFGQEDRDRGRFATIMEQAFSTAVRRTRARAWLTALVMLLVFGAVDLVVWIGAKDVIHGDMSGGELAAFVFYAVVVAGALGALSEIYGELQRASGAAERLIELLHTEADIRAPENPQPLAAPARGAISFDKVSFHYPSRPTPPALTELDLDIAAGESIALVGPSGAGKTTVFQLLLRFYEQSGGTISLDRVDIGQADPKEVRKLIGLVPQEPVIFAASVAENIRYGRPEASDGEVREAAKAANALEFIEALPDGFDTWLGERGVRLSGGQRQRLAVARAILRDPAILLLDEATSALDAESERMVQQALDKLMPGRTTIVIAHRLATVLKADRIVVLDAGRIVEVGQHQDLINNGGLYAHLAALQFDTEFGQTPLGEVVS
jgi:ATP-binding cassette subfamily B protein